MAARADVSVHRQCPPARCSRGKRPLGNLVCTFSLLGRQGFFPSQRIHEKGCEVARKHQQTLVLFRLWMWRGLWSFLQVVCVSIFLLRLPSVDRAVSGWRWLCVGGAWLLQRGAAPSSAGWFVGPAAAFHRSRAGGDSVVLEHAPAPDSHGALLDR